MFVTLLVLKLEIFNSFNAKHSKTSRSNTVAYAEAQKRRDEIEHVIGRHQQQFSLADFQPPDKLDCALKYQRQNKNSNPVDDALVNANLSPRTEKQIRSCQNQKHIADLRNA